MRRNFLTSIVLVLGLLTPLLATLWYTFSLEQRLVGDAFQVEMEQLTHSLAEGMADPVWNLFPESGEALAKAVASAPHILQIEVTSTAQGPFLAAGAPPPSERATAMFEEPIVYQGQKIGIVRVLADPSYNNGTLAAQRRQILLAASVAFLFALAIVATVVRLNLRLARSAVIEAANVRLKAEIVERRQANEALRASETQYRELLEGSTQGMIIHKDGRVVFANAAAERFLGYRKGEIVGLSRLDLIADQDVERINSFAANRQEGWMEFRSKRKDGSTVWTEGTASEVMWDGGQARLNAFLDVDERKRAEAALQDSEEMLRLTADSLPALVAYTDTDDRIRFLNQTGGAWFGVSARDAVGMHLRDVIGADLYAEMVRRRDAVPVGETVRFEADQLLEGGGTRPMETTVVPHRALGDTLFGFFVLSVDLSERKLAAAQIRQMQKMETVGRLTGGVAHDFNNLLAVILSSAEMLRDKPDGDAKLVASIERAATRGGELTQRLLSFSRQQALRPGSIDLGTLLGDFTDMARRVLGEKIDIQTGLATDIASPWADAAQLETALLNLAVNARDAMPDGGRLSIECRNANRALDGDELARADLAPEDCVVIVVNDTGVGMPPEVSAKAFEPFFTTKGVGEGSGLGLAMVYGFAKQSRGHVTIDSMEGQGTSVKIFLPRARPMVEQPEGQMSGALETSLKGERPIVLLVEDEPDVAEIIARLAEGLGYEILQASDVASGRRILRERPRIDVLLSDVVLPGGENGPALIDEARRLHGNIAIVFMSGYAVSWVDGSKHRSSDFVVLQKPVHRRSLASAIEQAIAAA